MYVFLLLSTPAKALRCGAMLKTVGTYFNEREIVSPANSKLCNFPFPNNNK